MLKVTVVKQTRSSTHLANGNLFLNPHITLSFTEKETFHCFGHYQRLGVEGKKIPTKFVHSKKNLEYEGTNMYVKSEGLFLKDFWVWTRNHFYY